MVQPLELWDIMDVAWRCGLPGQRPTCVYPAVVLQVPRRGELLAAVLLRADEGLLAVVGPHVNLQPLQHVEALAAALGAAAEHAVVPAGSRDVSEPLAAAGAQTALNFAEKNEKSCQHVDDPTKHLFEWEAAN